MYRTPLLAVRRRVLRISVLILFLPGGALAQRRPPSSDSFRLVAQAFSAKRDQHFIARQDIVLFQTAPDGAVRTATRIVADIAQDGGRVRRTFRLPADAADRVEVDDGHIFQQWEPSQHLVFLKQSHEAAPEEKRRMLGLLHSNYQCLPQCAQTVNGLPCDVVLIRPQRARGGGKRIWIDGVHRAILRTEEYDTSGRLCYLSYYETIRFVGHIAPGLFRLAGMGQVRRVPRLMRDARSFGAAFSAAGLPGRLPAWLPPGYAMIGCAGASNAAVLRYGDGLQTFIVIEERADAGGGPSHKLSRGGPPVSAPGRQIARSGQQVWEMTDSALRVTVLSNPMLPPRLGQEVLWSLKRASEATLRSHLADDFGRGALSQADSLRGRGWGYDQIVSLDLYLRGHPGSTHAAAARCRRGQDWAQVMSSLHADPDPWEQQARTWMLNALRGPQTTERR